MAAATLTAERLREILRYDPETGVFFRLVATSNFIKVGDVAGSPMPRGYIDVSVDGHRCLAHRLVWLYIHGRWPSRDIDHIDGNPGNNRLSNLRECTMSENQQNQRHAQAGNTSGLLGVHWSKSHKKWRAQIVVNGRYRSLGQFHTKEAAHAAYLVAKTQAHPFSTMAAV